jgi:hypothetical protein
MLGRALGRQSLVALATAETSSARGAERVPQTARCDVYLQNRCTAPPGQDAFPARPPARHSDDGGGPVTTEKAGQ